MDDKRLSTNELFQQNLRTNFVNFDHSFLYRIELHKKWHKEILLLSANKYGSLSAQFILMEFVWQLMEMSYQALKVPSWT